MSKAHMLFCLVQGGVLPYRLFSDNLPHLTKSSRMSQNRKSRVRSRLREVDAVIEAVKTSGVQLKALVG